MIFIFHGLQRRPEQPKVTNRNGSEDNLSIQAGNNLTASIDIAVGSNNSVIFNVTSTAICDGDLVNTTDITNLCELTHISCADLPIVKTCDLKHIHNNLQK